MDRILLIGQSPKNEDNFILPFHGTPSGKRLHGWLDAAGIDKSKVDYINAMSVIPKSTASIRSVTDEDIMRVASDISKYSFVISAGVIAGFVVGRTREIHGLEELVHINIQHPSGLNRNLNNKEVVDSTINLLKDLRSRYENSLKNIRRDTY